MVHSALGSQPHLTRHIEKLRQAKNADLGSADTSSTTELRAPSEFALEFMDTTINYGFLSLYQIGKICEKLEGEIEDPQAIKAFVALQQSVNELEKDLGDDDQKYFYKIMTLVANEPKFTAVNAAQKLLHFQKDGLGSTKTSLKLPDDKPMRISASELNARIKAVSNQLIAFDKLLRSKKLEAPISIIERYEQYLDAIPDDLKRTQAYKATATLRKYIGSKAKTDWSVEGIKADLIYMIGTEKQNFSTYDQMLASIFSRKIRWGVFRDKENLIQELKMFNILSHKKKEILNVYDMYIKKD